MAVDILGVILGSCIGLTGGLLGVTVAHVFTARRERTARKVAGVQDVQREVEKRSKLALEIAQHVNAVGYDGRKLFQLPAWRSCTLALQDRSWKPSCMVYLPAAVEDFRSLVTHISQLMDEQHDHTKIAGAIQKIVTSIEAQIVASLSQSRMEKS